MTVGDVNEEPYRTVTLQDKFATCPIITQSALVDMGHCMEWLDAPHSVPTGFGDITVIGAVQLLWNELDDDCQLIRYNTTQFYVTEETLDPYDVIVPKNFK